MLQRFNFIKLIFTLGDSYVLFPQRTVRAKCQKIVKQPPKSQKVWGKKMIPASWLTILLSSCCDSLS